MRLDKQRVAIAEFCGYKDIALREVGDAQTGCGYYDWCSGICGKGGVVIPEYINDLNAMHKAEQMMTPMQKLNYKRKYLWDAYYDGLPVEKIPLAAPVDATAAQRAKALLKTIGKWED